MIWVRLPWFVLLGFFSQVSSRAGHPSELVQLIPDALASYIPKSLLVFGEEEPNVQDLNNKPWTRDQVMRGGLLLPLPASPALCGAVNSPNPPGNGAVFPGKPLSSAFASQAAMFFGDVVKAEPDLSR